MGLDVFFIVEKPRVKNLKDGMSFQELREELGDKRSWSYTCDECKHVGYMRKNWTFVELMCEEKDCNSESGIYRHLSKDNIQNILEIAKQGEGEDYQEIVSVLKPLLRFKRDIFVWLSW